MNRTIRCAIYTRKSTEEGLEQHFNSLHAQREACEAYVFSQAGEGWASIDTAYDDGGYSGGSMDRPALRQLLADIGRGLINVVVVYKVDRLTRSLMDFTRIVQAMDANKVAFVSVTQAFNTTSSMGRLTLNMLLSFAQFEREITGERIRDKVAASKAKGFRMGGHPPLGYDIAGGRLALNPAEAVRLRAIFQRYRETGDLTGLWREGVHSKRWVNRSGVTAGGGLMSRGAIRYLLMNPAYRGATRHKEKLYPDTHPAIVDNELWDAVQTLLNVRVPPRSVKEPALLTDRLFDDDGNAMTLVYTPRGAKRYRYYVSRAKLYGTGQSGSLGRISAGVIERFLDLEVGPLLAHGWMRGAARAERLVSAIVSATLSDNQVVVRLANKALSAEVAAVDIQDADAETRTVRLPFYAQRRQGAVVIQSLNGCAPPARPNRALIRAVVLARSWSARLEAGLAPSVRAIAREEGRCSGYTTRLMPLAYLAPDLVQQILEGRQPLAMTLSALTRKALPVDWDQQRRLFQGGPAGRTASGMWPS